VHFFFTFVFTGVLFGVDRAIAVGVWIRHKSLVRKFTKARLERLHRLTEDEKKILRFYIAQQTKTNVLRWDDGVVNGLVAEQIIFQSSEYGSVLDGFPYNITDFAWDYLHKHIYLLDGTTNEYRTDKRDRRY